MSRLWRKRWELVMSQKMNHTVKRHGGVYMGRTGKYSSHKYKQSEQYDLKVKTTNQQNNHLDRKRKRNLKLKYQVILKGINVFYCLLLWATSLYLNCHFVLMFLKIPPLCLPLSSSLFLSWFSLPEHLLLWNLSLWEIQDLSERSLRDLYEKKMFCLHADLGLGCSLRPQWDILFLSWNIPSYKFVTGFLCMASYILMSQDTRLLYHSSASVRILSKFKNFSTIIHRCFFLLILMRFR